MENRFPLFLIQLSPSDMQEEDGKEKSGECDRAVRSEVAANRRQPDEFAGRLALLQAEA